MTKNQSLAERYLQECPSLDRLEKLCIKRFAEWLDERPSDKPSEQPKNWALWRCYRHDRMFAAHAGCSVCRTDPDPSSEAVPKYSDFGPSGAERTKENEA